MALSGSTRINKQLLIRNMSQADFVVQDDIPIAPIGLDYAFMMVVLMTVRGNA